MPKSLLLADDSTTIRTAVGMVFKKEDFALTTVANGTEALERARDLKPDLILADINMPGLSGYELCEKVRADAALKQTPVLLLGGGATGDPSRAISVGANGQMAKPFDSQKLIDQVKQILANPKPMAAGAQLAAATAPRPSAPPPPPEAMSSEVEEEILLDEDLGDDVPPSPQLRAVPSPSAKPPLSVVPPASDRRATGDGGEALLREALSKASREVIEKIAWEVVPELAETIIREELERLMKERGA